MVYDILSRFLAVKKRIFPDITYVIGKTPLIYLNRIARDSRGRIAAKLEYLNPGGSIKDRIALNMIQDAEKRGFLRSGSTLVEATSGNTGTSLALVCAVRGYRLILTMPDSVSAERVRQLEAFGAEVITTPGQEGMKGAIQKAMELAESDPEMFMLQQFNNPSNPEAHEKTTAQEIWDDTAGEVGVLVAGVGTGGSVTGIATALRKKRRDIRIVAVEPYGSPVISCGRAGRHSIFGIGAGFVPQVLDAGLLDEIVMVKDEDALETALALQKLEGVPAGPSSGAAAWAALEIAKRTEHQEKLIVVLFPDGSEKYITMGLFT